MILTIYDKNDRNLKLWQLRRVTVINKTRPKTKLEALFVPKETTGIIEPTFVSYDKVYCRNWHYSSLSQRMVLGTITEQA